MSTKTKVSPPLSNRGANSLSDLISWDWYQATISDLPGPFEVMRVLSSLVPGSRWKAIKPLHNWSHAQELVGVEVGGIKVLYGGRDDVHVQATSSIAELAVPLIRANWPLHTASRADVAYDVDEPGAFERLYKQVHKIARDGSSSGGRKVSTSQSGDWFDQVNGRTFYAGGAKSRMRVTVYEKGHEQLSKDSNCGASLDWTRVEWRVRPQNSKEKLWLSVASKEQALGFTPFGGAVADDVLDLAVASVSRVLRFASQDPAYWMAKQYAGPLRDLLVFDDGDLRDRITQLLNQASPKNA